MSTATLPTAAQCLADPDLLRAALDLARDIRVEDARRNSPANLEAQHGELEAALKATHERVGTLPVFSSRWTAEQRAAHYAIRAMEAELEIVSAAILRQRPGPAAELG
jgi:hypothetical protein